ncbi:uncharacterized protein LOC122047125 [Zingiber officinale]|uniref:Uncharacterized protein n=1 Tax=Zingiber officinale TaxID=94328 RepID=A0A8J5LQI8_ZINOF|nr:uncharacterized protein LOC122047125 [Zingiber officinale]KAG6525825.1 hypothetical protein ZIOFF_015796 [Zingiber officinale]
MEKKQGFFTAMREELAKAWRCVSSDLSRRPLPPMAEHLLLLSRRWKRLGAVEDPALLRLGGLAPLMEGPDTGEEAEWDSARKECGWGQWAWVRLPWPPSGSGSGRRSDLLLMLGVIASPLGPVHVSYAEMPPHLGIKDTPIETSSAQYILQQYTAASGGFKLLSSIKNSYVMGKVRMVATELETATRVIRYRNSSRDAVSGGFVLWQMVPEMWYMELSVSGSKIHAGCNGKLVWHHSPWVGAHAAKGPVRPLRRALQGLDPLTTATMFTNALCIGEKNVNGEDCFILKLCADPQTLKVKSEGHVEVIRHVLFGYFSQRSGLLIHMEDSRLTRIHANIGGDSVYWETSINSSINDYRPVEGIMIAHSGHSVITLFQFGEVALSHTKTRIEEAWTVDEVAFNVPGLSVDCFIPPADNKFGS